MINQHDMALMMLGFFVATAVLFHEIRKPLLTALVLSLIGGTAVWVSR
jgi:hypothetical protein